MITEREKLELNDLLNVAGASQGGVEAGLDVSPCTLVLVFFLRPEDLGIGVFSAFSFH